MPKDAAEKKVTLTSNRVQATIQEISVLVDQGRLIFPNSHRACYPRDDRDAARHGYRNVVLDPIKTVVDRWQEGTLKEEDVALMTGSFLTVVDAVLGPLQWNKTLCRYIARSALASA